MLARQEGHGPELPSFILLYLPNDHTWGTAKRFPRPAASVADNDLAVTENERAIQKHFLSRTRVSRPTARTTFELRRVGAGHVYACCRLTVGQQK